MAEPTDAHRALARELRAEGAPDAIAQALSDAEEHGYARGWGEGWEAGVRLALDALAARPTPVYAAETAVRNHAIACGMRPEAVQ